MLIFQDTLSNVKNEFISQRCYLHKPFLMIPSPTHTKNQYVKWEILSKPSLLFIQAFKAQLIPGTKLYMPNSSTVTGTWHSQEMHLLWLFQLWWILDTMSKFKESYRFFGSHLQYRELLIGNRKH